MNLFYFKREKHIRRPDICSWHSDGPYDVWITPEPITLEGVLRLGFVECTDPEGTTYYKRPYSKKPRGVIIIDCLFYRYIDGLTTFPVNIRYIHSFRNYKLPFNIKYNGQDLEPVRHRFMGQV